MVNVKRSIEGVTGGVVLLFLTIYSYFMFEALSAIMVITAMKAIYWVGLISVWGLSVFLTPFLMITEGKGSWLNVGKGFVFFVGGSVISAIVYYVGGGIADVMNSFLVLAGQITWLMIFAIWILLMVILPSYQVVKGSLVNNGEQNE